LRAAGGLRIALLVESTQDFGREGRKRIGLAAATICRGCPPQPLPLRLEGSQNRP
jgi:hypothetical protein